MDDAETKRIEESYVSLVKTPAGLDLLLYLSECIEQDIDAALNEIDPIKAVGLLQKVNGYRTIKSYIVRHVED